MPSASFKKSSTDMAVPLEGLFVDTASISRDQDQTVYLHSAVLDHLCRKKKGVYIFCFNGKRKEASTDLCGYN